MVPTEDAVSAKINQIREKALKELGGEPHEKCPTCGRYPSNPFREFDARGHVVSGCIDAIHSGRLVVPSESSRWHNRKEAKAWRREELKRLQDLSKKRR